MKLHLSKIALLLAASSTLLSAAENYTIAEDKTLSIAAGQTQAYGTVTLSSANSGIEVYGDLSIDFLNVGSLSSQKLSIAEGATLTLYDMDISKTNAWQVCNEGTILAYRFPVYGGNTTNTGSLTLDALLNTTTTRTSQLSTASNAYIYNSGSITLQNGSYYQAGGTSALRTVIITQVDTNESISFVGTGSSEDSYLMASASKATIAQQIVTNAKITICTTDTLALTSSTLINCEIEGSGDTFYITASDLTLFVDLNAQTDTLIIDTLSNATTANLSGALTINVLLDDTSSLSDQLTINLTGNLGTTDLSDISLAFYTEDEQGNLTAYATGDSGSWTTENGTLSFTSTNTIIPEPSTATLSLLALAGLLARRRRTSL